MIIKTLRKIKKTISLFKYRGDKFECPLCGFKSNSLSSIGNDSPATRKHKIIGAGKRFGGCYNCSSADRVRSVYLYLRDEYKLFNKDRDIKILHFAPEKHISEKIIKAGFTNYTCGDLFTDGYSYPSYVQDINILKMPFAPNSFDLVICNHVLEHIIPDQEAMDALYAVLKPNGTALLQVPISEINTETIEDINIVSNEERHEMFGQYDHVRVYGQDYIKRLEKSGFNVNVSDFNKTVLKYGVIENEKIYIATK